MAAGTGGHVFPALAVAEQLRQRGVEVHWLATEQGMEHRLVGPTGIPMHPIAIQGVRGKGLVRKLAAPFRVLSATLACMRLIRQLNVDVVAGFGGYVAGPGGVAARLLGVPLVIQEQNAVAGMTNSHLARFARTVLQAFPNTFESSARLVTSGNPIRAAIVATEPPEQRFAGRQGPIRILVVGGSLGAQALNEQLPAALNLLKQPLIVVHQCGQSQLEATQKRYESLDNPQLAVQVVPFIEDMATAYGEVDLVICRAGALTVTEIATVGVAAVFIPLPHAVDDHQTANARYLVDAEAALLCPQRELTPESLSDRLAPILQRDALLAMAIRARAMAQPHATETVVEAIEHAAL